MLTIIMLLRINEDLNSVFIRYQRFKNSRPADPASGDVPLLPEEPVPTGLLVRYMTHNVFDYS